MIPTAQSCTMFGHLWTLCRLPSPHRRCVVCDRIGLS
jgi:hypothetical protein